MRNTSVSKATKTNITGKDHLAQRSILRALASLSLLANVDVTTTSIRVAKTKMVETKIKAPLVLLSYFSILSFKILLSKARKLLSLRVPT